MSFPNNKLNDFWECKDIYWLAGQLGNLKGFYRISDPLFNHWDFLWSIRVNEYLNDHVIAHLP